MESASPPEGPVTKVNIGRLTNAIFAFVLLLLFKNVRIPSFSDYLAGSVNTGEFGYMQLPDIFSFLNAFLIIAMIWVITFHLFHQLVRVDRMYLYLHLAMMMMVIFIPVSSHMNVMFPGRSIFPVLFHANMLAAGMLLAFLWWHISSEPSIRRPGIGRVQLECTTMKVLYLPATAVAGMFLANLDLGHTQGIYLATMLAFVLTTLYSRKRERFDREAGR
jgi:uncharacterized membrane protein